MANDLNNLSTKVNLVDKYNLLNLDDDDNGTSSNWKKMLVEDGMSNSDIDWYSTKTFQSFLDALDVDKPCNLFNHDKKDNIHKSSGINQRLTNISADDGSGKSNLSFRLTTKSISNEDYKEPKKQAVNKKERTIGDETILSAEALKILSELPDLSHMSATRSFIFPSSNRLKR